ncbi:MAG: 1-acyl-sn-glycerol-3-phosphate acyltransferase [Anaerolineales bacterium]|nr:1-acyl-sn-glycerol-3-phosphate acyltransferase [Anaerolineales bacterium]
MLSKLLYKAGRIVIGAYARLMLKMDVHWQESLPQGPVLFAANHPSTTDPIYIHLISKQPMSVMINSKVFSIPVLGAYMRKMQQIEVIRDIGQSDQVLKQAVRALVAGRSVVIFPEGAISPANGFAPVRSGVARLALQSGVPVIPIGIHLRDENCKRVPTTLEGEPDVITWYLRGPYAITVGKPLHFQGDADDRPLVKTIAENIMEQIRSLAGESKLRMQLRKI